jgi:hypothetical protein
MGDAAAVEQHAESMFPVESLDGLDLGALTSVLQQVERIRRQAEAVLAHGVAVAERCQQFREDGHKTVTAWARATFNWPSRDAQRVARNGRVLAAQPVLAGLAAAGDLGVAQLDEFGRVHANPRCADQLGDVAELLAGYSGSLWCEEFRRVLRRWEVLADADGAHRAHDDADRGRHAEVGVVGAQVVVTAEGGLGQGLELREIFERFVDAEFRTDWDAAKAVLGDEVCVAALARTDRQRRFDALHTIFTTAAGAAPDVVPPDEPLVNYVVDAATADELLARAAGVAVPAADPAEFTERRCETADGVPVDPAQVLAAMLVGRLRRVVIDAAGVVIDLGRRSRLFTGGARDAVLLGGVSQRCLWPGCEQPAGRRCQIDHSVAWSDGGLTRPDNGGILCGHHNRHKARGYTVRRDPNGHWHTYRPNGAEVAAPALLHGSSAEHPVYDRPGGWADRLEPAPSTRAPVS